MGYNYTPHSLHVPVFDSQLSNRNAFIHSPGLTYHHLSRSSILHCFSSNNGPSMISWPLSPNLRCKVRFSLSLCRLPRYSYTSPLYSHFPSARHHMLELHFWLSHRSWLLAFVHFVDGSQLGAPYTHLTGKSAHSVPLSMTTHPTQRL